MSSEEISASARVPTVSVVIPTFNRAAKLPAVLQSVATQTMSDLEVIVVDDASTDGTQQLMAGLTDPRVRYLRHEKNRGGNAARATGVGAARAPYIAFLDSDDRWRPEKLRRQVDLLRDSGPDYGLCTTWFSMVTPTGDLRHRVEPTIRGIRRPELLSANVLGGYSTVLVSREALEKIGGPDPSLPSCQDWDLYLRLNEVTGVCVVPEHLVDYSWDVQDPVRISTRRDSVIKGHRHIYRMLRCRRSELDAAAIRDSAARFATTFALAGSPRDVLVVWRDLPLRCWNLGLLRHAVHMVLRSVRKAAVLGARTKE